MASDRHSFISFYPSDWIAGTARLKPITEWVYLQVCLYNWDKMEPVPRTELPGLFARHKGWRSDIEILVSMDKLHRTEGGAVFNGKALAKAREAYDLWEKKSRGGRAGQQARAENARKSPDGTSPSLPPSNHNLNQNLQEDSDESSSPHSPPVDADLVFSPPEPQWSQFVDFRKEVGKALTPHAKHLALRKLAALAQDGHDPAAVIEQSILQRWTGLFPLKDERTGRGGKKSGWA